MDETQQNPAESTDSGSGIIIFGADWCGDCRRAKRVLGELQVPYRWIDLVADPAAADVAREISGRTNIPVIAYPDGSHQVEPSDADMRAKLAELGLAAAGRTGGRTA